MSDKEYEYDVALSYASEQREYVEKVNECLIKQGIKVYFDKDQKLWGKDLSVEFSQVFYRKSKLAVAFISKQFAEKNWTRLEIRNAFARALEENNVYILPVRFDDTDIPGLLPTIHFEDARKLSPEHLCDKIINMLDSESKKVLSSKSSVKLEVGEEIEIPTIKRKITDLEKDKYLRDSFDILKQYFKKALVKVETSHGNVKTNLDEITNNKFIASVYVDGDLKTKCKIWIGSGISSRSVLYLEGHDRFYSENDSSYNDSAYIEENGVEIFFKISHIYFGVVDKNINTDKASADDLAIYFWKRFIKNLS